MAKPEEITTIQALEAEVEKIFLIEDKGLVRIVVATVIANRMSLDPVWLLLVAPSSGGKTEMIHAISKLEFVFPISDLTVNTFASGLKRPGQHTSLLMKMTNGIMAFKDFTSVLSKNKDARREIMAQLREIYDGEYVKRTGNGNDIVWRGKLGAIAGATEAVYRHLEELSAMGDRFVMYVIKQPDRIEVAMRALDNAHLIHQSREHLQKCFTFYINLVLKDIDTQEVVLNPEIKRELLHVADFATRVRSAVLRDFKTNLVDFVPSAEMPMRVTNQLYTLSAALLVIKRHDKLQHAPIAGDVSEIDATDKGILYKTAFDSIPKTRRMALFALAKYKNGVTTAGLATLLDLPTPSVQKYLQEVNALGICTRKKTGGMQGDTWTLKEIYREIMLKLDDIKEVIDGTLESDSIDAEDIESTWAGTTKAQDTGLPPLDFDEPKFDIEERLL